MSSEFERSGQSRSYSSSPAAAEDGVPHVSILRCGFRSGLTLGATRQMWLSSITAEGDKVEVSGALVFLGCSRDFELSIKKADPSLCSG